MRLEERALYSDPIGQQLNTASILHCPPPLVLHVTSNVHLKGQSLFRAACPLNVHLQQHYLF